MSDKAPVLPEDINECLRKMILLSEEIIKACEGESNAVAMGWETEFLQATGTKQSYALLYQKASKELLARGGEFAHADGVLITRFKEVQRHLQAESRTNMTILGPLVQKLQDNNKPVAAAGAGQ
ncbi:MAG: hypothetical protein ACRBCT_00280 [Alphaproteobacteria bacterium]